MTDDLLAPAVVDALKARVAALMPATRADLEALATIPSVSLGSFDQEPLTRSAHAVIGHRAGPPGAPTVTLYAHHDVQPPGEAAEWESEPFTPTERDGRLYGRGVADDKAGVMAHVTALRAFGDDLPVSVTVFVEGEEEIGSESLPAILERHGDALAADAIVLADSQNWKIGVPSLTTTLRGLVRVVVTVRTLDHAVHSGMFGGPVPDALTGLCRLVATLHDEVGTVAVAGLRSGQAADLPYDEPTLRAESGLLDGVSMTGTGSILDRLWAKPSLSVIGVDAPTVDRASNTLLPSARAKLSMRLAPDQDPRAAYELLATHLREHAPWGAQVEVRLDDDGPGFAAKATGPIYDQARAAFRDAWGTEPVDIGVGGSIPFIAAFAERFPQAAILVTGVEDPDTRAHGANESLHLGEFERACVAEALLLARLGAMVR